MRTYPPGLLIFLQLDSYFSFAGSIANIGGSEYKCKDGSDPEMHLKVIPGVLGAPSSVTSIQVANLLKLFKIPQVSDNQTFRSCIVLLKIYTNTDIFHCNIYLITMWFNIYLRFPFVPFLSFPRFDCFQFCCHRYSLCSLGAGFWLKY